jgi:molecular chaperone DnaJ
MVIGVINTPFGAFQQGVECHVCEGIGSNYSSQCTSCHGHGVSPIEETVDVTIPSGVFDNMTFVMGGKGHGIKGGEYGNLNITIGELKHAKYVRNGNDLRLTLKLDYTQLVLGDKIDIETIDGGKIRVNIPESSDVGMNLKVKNKGLKQYGRDHRGDIVITLNVEIPKGISSETRELLLKLKS